MIFCLSTLLLLAATAAPLATAATDVRTCIASSTCNACMSCLRLYSLERVNAFCNQMSTSATCTSETGRAAYRANLEKSLKSNCEAKGSCGVAAATTTEARPQPGRSEAASRDGIQLALRQRHRPRLVMTTDDQQTPNSNKTNQTVLDSLVRLVDGAVW
ncbi:hypothetical protein BOX15_Mlig030109g1 [Macrostomum lignano]|uniref:Uncharacterized protein n=1 Tax=Macrostomum lignano TaxID=282301 RepID=A0A267GDA1_9PLAT|nr:hypothetical protein BOX15_Mlig030109g1 [Macrostomum lignano]